MSITVEPTRQRLTALEQANGVRGMQREWKEDMAARTRRDALREAASVLRDHPGRAGALTIHTFLLAIPKIGDTKARHLLVNHRDSWYVWPFRKVRDLTPRQREVLAGKLEQLAAAQERHWR